MERKRIATMESGHCVLYIYKIFNEGTDFKGTSMYPGLNFCECTATSSTDI